MSGQWDAVRAQTRSTLCAECGSPCKEALYGLPPACSWSCAAKVHARRAAKAKGEA